MKENKKETRAPDGIPWKNAAKFETWEKADQKRTSLVQEWKKNGNEHMQVKVKKLAACFVVKVRTDPTIKKVDPVKKNKKKLRKKK